MTASNGTGSIPNATGSMPNANGAIPNRTGAAANRSETTPCRAQGVILVTGGAGFIGANFVQQWLRIEHTPVVNLDRLTYAGNLRSLAALRDDPRHLFVRGDIASRELVAALLAEHQPTAIVAIMYLGRIVETGPVEQIFEDAAHPYTPGPARVAAAPAPAQADLRAREGGTALRHRAAARVRVPPALPVRDARVPHHAAAAPGDRARPHRRLPFADPPVS